MAIHSPTPKTYVLIGHDNESMGLDEYQKRPDVIILRARPGESIQQVAKRIHGPANVILQAHGLETGIFASHGMFTWNQGETIPYSTLFSALPKVGIISITIASCYGGTGQTEQMLRSAPPGVLVIPLTGPKTLNTAALSLQFAKEIRKFSKPIDLYLEGLDNFDSQTFKGFQTHMNQQSGTQHVTDPEAALPHIIGVGGNPPVRINLMDAMGQLKGKEETSAFKRSLRRVQERFDTVNRQIVPDYPGYVRDVSLGQKAERALDIRIAQLGQKLAIGYLPKDVDEKRIALAITAAYLDESGELQRLAERQPGYINPFTKFDANDNIIHPRMLLPHPSENIFERVKDWVKHATNKHLHGITTEEQAYINSVAKKLGEDSVLKSQLDGVLKSLVTVFSKTSGNDQLNPNSNLVKTLHQAGISTRSWER